MLSPPLAGGIAGLRGNLPGLEGESLVPLLRGQDAPWRDWAISQYRSSGDPENSATHLAMLRSGTRKLIAHHGALRIAHPGHHPDRVLRKCPPRGVPAWEAPDMTEHAHTHAPSAHHSPDPDLSPTEHWEQRYSGQERMWSGKVNETMAEIVRPLPPGAALDLGCGEGGDVLWLAEHGWHTRGLDISTTAVARARDEAAARGLDHATFTAVDLEAWRPEPRTVDLVTASFFQSHVALDRLAILRRAATAVRPGGRLVIVSHAAPPSWASDHPAPMVSVEEDAAALDLPEEEWSIEVCEDRPRAAVGPDGAHGQHLDAVLVMRRR